MERSTKRIPVRHRKQPLTKKEQVRLTYPNAWAWKWTFDGYKVWSIKAEESLDSRVLGQATSEAGAWMDARDSIKEKEKTSKK